MRRLLIIPALVALSLGSLTAAPVQADEASSELPQVTIMGDSHTLLMINDIFPGQNAGSDKILQTHGYCRHQAALIRDLKLQVKGPIVIGVKLIDTRASRQASDVLVPITNP